VRPRLALVAAFLVAASCPACSRPTESATLRADASSLVALSVRVPAALAIGHAIDALSVVVDPASFGLTEVTVHAGTVVGVEAHVLVFPRGKSQAAALVERRAVGPGTEFDVGTSTWTTAQDGVPAGDARYEVEMQLTLFETDVAVAKPWDPHAGNFRVLWTRTLRQAEE
jgi:hypothetical protein